MKSRSIFTLASFDRRESGGTTRCLGGYWRSTEQLRERIKIGAQCPFVYLDLQRVTKVRRETLQAAQYDGSKLRRSMEHFW